MNCEWHYVILDDKSFYQEKQLSASLYPILMSKKLTRERMENRMY